jgi:hypothetical protein
VNVGQNSGSEAAITVKLYAFTCGAVTGDFARLMDGGEGDVTVPIPVFLIEHPKGWAHAHPANAPTKSRRGQLRRPAQSE